MPGNSDRRIVAIGDIHGCVHALHAVLDAVRPRANDLVISLGDFVDFGRDTCEVIEVLLRLRRRCELVTLLGNHEEMLLAALENEKLKQTWHQLGGIATLNSYRFGADIEVIPAEHIEFIRGCLPYYETETHIFLHANYDPDLPLAKQPEHLLRWTLLDDPRPRPHGSGKTAIVGHSEQRSGEVLDLGCVKCIDTYCHGGGWLTALEVNSGQIWQASRFGVLRTEFEEAA